MAAALALALSFFWTTSSGWVLRRLHVKPESLAAAVSTQIVGNVVVVASGVVFLLGSEGSLVHFSRIPDGHDAAVALLGIVVAAPGSVWLARLVRREVAPIELEIRQLALPRRIVTLAFVPLTEELIWRGVTSGALVALGAPFGLAVMASGVLGVLAHANAFTVQGLLRGVAPSSVGISVAYYYTRNLWVAVLVHLAADLEILFPVATGGR
ncbi:MAG: Type prenyl endopeptidase Rce1-like [Actinomycetota bacterium]|nr:Type prenyl endopeptidase Rce1-like [Actinomycetota bacterium]